MTQEYSIRLFGEFRQYASGPTVTVTLGGPATVADLRRAFAAQLGDGRARRLLTRSAFADDQRVLADADRLTTAGELAILPPVAGG